MNVKHALDIRRFLRNGDFKETPQGLLIHGTILARGKYTTTVNGKDPQVSYNLVPTEGINYILDAALGADAQITVWYAALFSGNVTPLSTWTAANFAALASEIVSTTEGYVESTRPIWVPGAAAVGVIGNAASKAIFTINCTTSVDVSGAALLSTNTRGGTTGKLVSATRFGSVRTVYDADAFELTYEVELQDS